jgi:quercetin dioxygenase-like cupin family protein
MENIEKGKVFNYKDAVRFANEAVVSRTIIKKPSGNITLFAFAKGQALSEHTAPFDALVYIVEGIAEIIIDGQSHNLNEGESIIMPANIPHAVTAIENFKMVLTMIKEKTE